MSIKELFERIKKRLGDKYDLDLVVDTPDLFFRIFIVQRKALLSVTTMIDKSKEFRIKRISPITKDNLLNPNKYSCVVEVEKLRIRPKLRKRQ